MNHRQQAVLPFDILPGPQGPAHAPIPGEHTPAPNDRATSSSQKVTEDDIHFVRNPRARRYVLRVQDDGRVRVTLPRWGSKREAKAFADSQRRWVEQQRVRLARFRAERGAEFGRPNEASGVAETEWARDVRWRARHELPARLLELAQQFGLAVRKVSVRDQKWRWGSCSPAGHICLNWRLAAMPHWVRDYVLIHELMHLKRMDHSERFWALVAAACPVYQDARRWLREHGRGLR